MALTVSYLNTPQAVDDTFTISAADLTVQQFDVMANDSGGKAKTLYSLDGGEVSSDLLVRDTTKGSELSANGATIWMTTEGKLAYDASALADKLSLLAEGEVFEDSFSYAIQLGNGTLSVATAIVRIIGVNDAPVAREQAVSFEAGAAMEGMLAATDVDSQDLTYSIAAPVDGVTVDAHGRFSVAAAAADQAMRDGESRVVSFQYKANDGKADSAAATVTVTIKGKNDAPTAADDTNSAQEDTGLVMGSVASNDGDVDNGAGLAYALEAPVDGLTLNTDGSYTFDTSHPSYQYLAAGETAQVVASYSVMDEHGATASAKLTITLTGVADDAPSVAVDDTVITNIVAGNPIVIPDSALLANDSGDELTITEVTALSGDTVVQSSTNVVFTDQGSEGGSFEYSVDGGIAVVTVDGQSSSTLSGTDNGDILIAGSGSDTLYGYAGDDVLMGGAGADRMAGGSGADLFVLGHNGAVDTYDMITDFSKADGDKLDFRDLLSSFGLADHSQAFAQTYLTFLAWGTSGTQINADFNGTATDGQFGGSLGAIAIITNAQLTQLDTGNFIL